jgi:hypothetical protein
MPVVVCAVPVLPGKEQANLDWMAKGRGRDPAGSDVTVTVVIQGHG